MGKSIMNQYSFVIARGMISSCVKIGRGGRNGGCLSRLRKNIASGVFRRDGRPHNHPPELEVQRRLAAVNRACELVASTSDRPRDIFNRVRRE